MTINFSFFQIILAGISFVFLINGLWKFIKKEQNQTFFKVLYTTFIWGGVMFLSLYPDSLRGISEKLGLGETLNPLIFFGFVLVFIAIFKLLSSIEGLEQTISRLVRKQALNDLDEFINKDGEKNK